MIFPAINLHLWLGFSVALLNNQMVLHGFATIQFSPVPEVVSTGNLWGNRIFLGVFLPLVLYPPAIKRDVLENVPFMSI
jgi:hypothetical protein